MLNFSIRYFIGHILLCGFSLLVLAGCSGNNDVAKASEDSAGPARSFVNNGYYLSGMELEFVSGNSISGNSIVQTYSIDYDANTITRSRSVDSPNGPVTVIGLVYRYTEAGDLAGISTYDTDVDQNPPVRTEIQRTTIQRQGGVLVQVEREILVGNESDTTGTYSYNPDGTIKRFEQRFADSGLIEFQDFNYVDGQLMSIVGNDVEVEGLSVTQTFVRDTDGTALSKTTNYTRPNALFDESETINYSYDENGNVSSREIYDALGALRHTETYTYEIAAEPVFNLQNMILYFN